MISVDLARHLRDAGLSWQPAQGDRFVVEQPEMEHEVFVLSDFTVEVHEFPAGEVLGFNGTTEWALDSVDRDRTLWLPDEDQLREQLGDAFRALERDGVVYRVTLEGDAAASNERFEDVDAAQAYGRALLHLLTSRDSGPGT